MNIPSNMSYGTVTGRFLLAYADSSDSGQEPDAVPAQGSIYFAPSAKVIKNANASPAPVTILPAVVHGTLDANGYLLGPDGEAGIQLTATDDPSGNPVDWTWSVSFQLTDADGTPVPVPSFSIELPSGTTVDLTNAMPVQDANGTYYLIGPTGPANTLSVGNVTTVAYDADPTVTITGTAPNQTIDFGIPAGVPNTLSVGTVNTVSYTTPASATITGTSPSQTLNLSIPKGPENVLSVGTVSASAPGSEPSVTVTGTSPSQTLNFVLPRGETGPIGPTGATGITWQGVWSSTTDYVNNDAVYYDNSSWFASGNPTVGEVPSLSATHWFPLALHGATGATGPQGDAATITVGTVTTGAPGSSATVTNVGTSGAAVFNFSIPKGDTGDIGNISATSPITYTSNTIGLDHSAIQYIDGGTA